MKVKIAYIRWLDAAGSYQTWVSGKKLDVRGEIQSSGFVVYENKEVITIATDFDGTNYRDVSSIPKSCILEKRIVALGKLRKK
jgi:hypothetical protein